MELLPLFVNLFVASACIWANVRRSRVMDFMCDLRCKVADACIKDAMCGIKSDWRIAVLESVSVGKMTWTFWKPIKVESFWQNNLFTEF